MGCPVTIITPTLNAAAYLDDCLTSVREQGVVGLEHLVVDGGSTDATLEVASRTPGVTWVSRPGWSQSRAINEGLRLASGDVVAWLNADDAYTNGSLNAVLAAFSGDQHLDAVYGDCDVVGADGEHLWWERPGAYDFGRLLARGNYIPQPAVFMRRQLIEQVGGLDESLELAMDFDLWLRLRGRNVLYVSRPLARFRWHPDSKSARGPLRGWRELLRVVRAHGGGWTPFLAWAYGRCLITVGRTRATELLTGSRPVRPLARSR
jgi:glycosyltransferase involved in cell wall biosynthesis